PWWTGSSPPRGGIGSSPQVDALPAPSRANPRPRETMRSLFITSSDMLREAGRQPGAGSVHSGQQPQAEHQLPFSGHYLDHRASEPPHAGHDRHVQPVELERGQETFSHGNRPRGKTLFSVLVRWEMRRAGVATVSSAVPSDQNRSARRPAPLSSSAP